MKRRGTELGKGALSGLIGGLIGTVAMTAFQNGWKKASEARKQDGDGQRTRVADEEREDSTMKAAGKLGKALHRPLSRDEEQKLGPVLHYCFGTLQGGVYGTVTELSQVRGGLLPGLTFGATLFILADEIAVPRLGLSGNPGNSPLSAHIYGLAAHLVYGIITEIARRGIRAAL